MIYAACVEIGKHVPSVRSIRMGGGKCVPSTMYSTNDELEMCTPQEVSHESRSQNIHESQLVYESYDCSVQSVEDESNRNDIRPNRAMVQSRGERVKITTPG